MIWPRPISVRATSTCVVLVVTSSLTTLVGLLTEAHHAEERAQAAHAGNGHA